MTMSIYVQFKDRWQINKMQDNFIFNIKKSLKKMNSRKSYLEATKFLEKQRTKFNKCLVYT